VEITPAPKGPDAVSVLAPHAGGTAAITRTPAALASLFAVGLLSAALLMFILEPMAAKMILPHLGGAPAVWNTCVVFFQATLLVGYAYAHLGPKWLGLRRHAFLHVTLLVISTLAVWSALPIRGAPNSSSPILSLLRELVTSIGLPFFFLSTTAPLLQRWFASTDHRSARDPYFLYAASNLGSLVGLLMYPAVLEPFLPLVVQAQLWRYGYITFAFLITACALSMRFGRIATATASPTTAIADAPPALGAYRRLWWVALSFAPSSLMLAVTTFISTDIAAVPLLWVVPLAIYLLTFVLAFGSSPRYPRKAVDRGFPILLLPLVIFLVLRIGGPIELLVPLHLMVFALAALACHRLLADDRPHPAHLTEFYLFVALGGVLGSLFNTLAAPLLFTGIVEYPLVLVLVCLLRDPADDSRIGRNWRIIAPIAAALITMVLISWTESLPLKFGLLGVPMFLCLSLSRTRVPFAAAIAAILIVSSFQPDERGRVLHADRTFFGTYRVRLDQDGSHRTLTHGTTIHGAQSVDRSHPAEPLSYYHSNSPLADVFAGVPIVTTHPQIGVVGLGVGSVAAFRKPAQTWTFFELDPAVERIARREEFFSYMSECGSACKVVIGDARQSLSHDRTLYGGLILDAFSSDAIPLHLVTRQALDVYLNRLAPGGVLAFHISNRHLDLEPVLARLAEDARLVSVIRRDRLVTPQTSKKTGSDWLLMARERQHLGAISSDVRWTPSKQVAAVGVWTDDFSNIITLLLRH
jgi:hypothetical protein